MLVICKDRKRTVRNVRESDREHFHRKETHPIIRKRLAPNGLQTRQEIHLSIQELKPNKQEDENIVQVEEKEAVPMLLHMNGGAY